jgi:hypothetical protein
MLLGLAAFERGAAQAIEILGSDGEAGRAY